jgi:hypothetical protein
LLEDRVEHKEVIGESEEAAHFRDSGAIGDFLLPYLTYDGFNFNGTLWNSRLELFSVGANSKNLPRT